jgi:hypothetical protein
MSDNDWAKRKAKVAIGVFLEDRQKIKILYDNVSRGSNSQSVHKDLCMLLESIMVLGDELWEWATGERVD